MNYCKNSVVMEKMFSMFNNAIHVRRTRYIITHMRLLINHYIFFEIMV